MVRGATARRRLRVLGVTCNAGDVRCPSRRVTLLAFLRLCAGALARTHTSAAEIFVGQDNAKIPPAPNPSNMRWMDQ